MKPRNEKILKTAAYGLGLAKSLHYTTQGILLPLIDRIVGGKKDRTAARFGQHIQMAFPKVQSLLARDAENIAAGIYPAQVIFEESLLTNYFRFPKLIRDAFRANLQRKNKKTSEFDLEAQEFADQAPEYYQRNFHFQKSGYLNDESAELYEHQVEILFSGTANVMRRQMIPALKKHFKTSDGKGLKFLEIACGTGALTRALALAFPKAQIICLDLSPHYLKKAQEKLSEFKNLSFVQGLAENLDFKDETFDAVFSCYLFHELPAKVRNDVMAEKYRVLKKDGFIATMDSIQKGDDSELEWALKQFPVDFHEPFYKNYVENSLETLFKQKLNLECQTETYFLTKLVYAKK